MRAAAAVVSLSSIPCRTASQALQTTAQGPWLRHKSHTEPPGLIAWRRQAGAAAIAGSSGAAVIGGAPAPQQQEDEWSIATVGGKQAYHRPDLHVVLVSPQIPQNAGNVARTCAATNIGLHLVGPCGFELDSKKLKRAGLDYWPAVCVELHPSWDAFLDFWQQQAGPKQLIGYTKFAGQHYAGEGLYPRATSTWLMFGAETSGLPEQAHAAATHMVKIPMSEQHVRSLNLATSVGIGVMEALRQKDGAVLPEHEA